MKIFKNYLKEEFIEDDFFTLFKCCFYDFSNSFFIDFTKKIRNVECKQL